MPLVLVDYGHYTLRKLRSTDHFVDVIYIYIYIIYLCVWRDLFSTTVSKDDICRIDVYLYFWGVGGIGG